MKYSFYEEDKEELSPEEMLAQKNRGCAVIMLFVSIVIILFIVFAILYKL